VDSRSENQSGVKLGVIKYSETQRMIVWCTKHGRRPTRGAKALKEFETWGDVRSWVGALGMRAAYRGRREEQA
jgi:hypothetical protein